MGSFGKTALSGQISGFSPQGKMGSFGNFSFWAFRGWISEHFIFDFHISFHSFKLPARRWRSS
jgi:hypothetical protein